MRDPGFRRAVLRAHEHRCAVCGFDIRLGARSLALDGAHIKWHQAGGPDDVQNGLALCVLHHKLFDEGAFTLSPPGERSVVLVSEAAIGTTGFDGWLGRFTSRPFAHRFARPTIRTPRVSPSKRAASLPGIPPTASDLDSYHGTMNLQRLRLKRNQQAPEWSDDRYVK